MGTDMDGLPRYQQARQGKASCKPPARLCQHAKATHLTSRLVAEKNGAARPSAAEWVPTQNNPCPQPNRATHRNPASPGCPFLSRVLVLLCQVPVYPDTMSVACRMYMRAGGVLCTNKNRCDTCLQES